MISVKQLCKISLSAQSVYSSLVASLFVINLLITIIIFWVQTAIRNFVKSLVCVGYLCDWRRIHVFVLWDIAGSLYDENSSSPINAVYCTPMFTIRLSSQNDM
jgi:hypothetical protein